MIPIYIIILVVFGLATLFFWAKWVNTREELKKVKQERINADLQKTKEIRTFNYAFETLKEIVNWDLEKEEIDKLRNNKEYSIQLIVAVYDALDKYETKQRILQQEIIDRKKDLEESEKAFEKLEISKEKVDDELMEANRLKKHAETEYEKLQKHTQTVSDKDAKKVLELEKTLKDFEIHGNFAGKLVRKFATNIANSLGIKGNFLTDYGTVQIEETAENVKSLMKQHAGRIHSERNMKNKFRKKLIDAGLMKNVTTKKPKK